MQPPSHITKECPIRALYKLKPAPHPPLLLAPIAGYSAAPLRMLCSQQGADLTFTEMTHARGLLVGNGQTWHTLATMPPEGPVVAHLYGTIPDDLAEATARVAATGRFIGIDLNAGCPVRKVTIHGAGAALLRNPSQIYTILKAMRQATTLPLSIKTRLGPSPDKIRIFEVLSAAQEAGANLLSLHARFSSQGHGGATHLDLLAEVKQRATIPIIGNGGINTPYTARQMLAHTSVDGLMIARGALGNPWIFSDLAQAFATTPDTPNTDRERPKRDLEIIRATLATHLEAEEALFRSFHDTTTPTPDEIEHALVTTFRHHLFRYLHGLKGSSYVRAHLHTLKNRHDIWHAVNTCLQRESTWRQGK